MTSKQRTKNDEATTDRREVEDKLIRDNRIKNDELTLERRNKADEILIEHRTRNDELTANRREINDRNPSLVIAVTLLVLVALAIGAYFFLI